MERTELKKKLIYINRCIFLGLSGNSAILSVQ